MPAFGLTDVGKVRTNNQDTYLCHVLPNSDQMIFVVCDGMGGAQAGNVASDLAARVFTDHIKQHIRPQMSKKYMVSVLTNAVIFANYETFHKSNSSDEFAGMGTTLVGGLISGDTAIVANIGDSRMYYHDGNAFRRVTKDHSLVEEMLDRGEITPKEAQSHPHKNLITRALGTDRKVEADLYELVLKHGDRLLLCSDGLSNLVSEEELAAYAGAALPLEEICVRLVDLANMRGGFDNITVLLISKEDQVNG